MFEVKHFKKGDKVANIVAENKVKEYTYPFPPEDVDKDEALLIHFFFWFFEDLKYQTKRLLKQFDDFFLWLELHEKIPRKIVLCCCFRGYGRCIFPFASV